MFNGFIYTRVYTDIENFRFVIKLKSHVFNLRSRLKTNQKKGPKITSKGLLNDI